MKCERYALRYADTFIMEMQRVNLSNRHMMLHLDYGTLPCQSPKYLRDNWGIAIDKRICVG